MFIKPYFIAQESQLTAQDPQFADRTDLIEAVNDCNKEIETVIDNDTIEVDTTVLKRPRGRPRKTPQLTVYLQEEEEDIYTASRYKEVLGLLEKGYLPRPAHPLLTTG